MAARLPQLGLLADSGTGYSSTPSLSRHMFVWLTYSQILTAVIAGYEAAWSSFGAVKTLVPDNMKAVATNADAVNPQLSTSPARRFRGQRDHPGRQVRSSNALSL